MKTNIKKIAVTCLQIAACNDNELIAGCKRELEEKGTAQLVIEAAMCTVFVALAFSVFIFIGCK